LSELQKPILVCHGNDWVTLFNNLARVGLDGDFQKLLTGVLDFLQVVSNHDDLNKGSLSLLKLSTAENLSEKILKISREEILEKGHDARFDTEILMRVFRKYLGLFESDVKGMWNTYIQPSDNLVYRAALFIQHIGDKRSRRRKANAKSVEYKVFNGWRMS
jgi:hypothetical protein